jgi:hypothetical protein
MPNEIIFEAGKDREKVRETNIMITNNTNMACDRIEISTILSPVCLEFTL